MGEIKVSVIIPTLNAGELLPTCLRALLNQDFPREQMEILVPDGGSTDATRKIAEEAGALVLDNPYRVAESGKRVALSQARGKFILFIDADNEITATDFLRLGIEALESYPTALGLESYYPASAQMSSICHYLTQTLHIGDPVSWVMSVQPRLVERSGEFELWTFPDDRLAYPLGANGFLYRRSDLEAMGVREHFEDTQIALKLALSGRKHWVRLRNRGVHHYLVKGVGDFVRKRRRQTYHFLRLRGEERGPSWTQMNPTCSPLIACIYCATLVGPIFHALLGLLRTRDLHWLWHPIASFLSVVGLTWGVLTYFTARHSADREASLQPKQKI
jgi:glycosyltransferase involved in cell wall biosynthesis